MLSSRFQIRALLTTQKTSTKANAVGLIPAAAAGRPGGREKNPPIPHPAKTLSTSQSHPASSWSEEQQGHRTDAQKPEPRRSWQRTRGEHCSKSLQLHAAQALPSLQGGVSGCPWRTNLLSSTQVPVAEQHRAGVRCPFSSRSN